MIKLHDPASPYRKKFKSWPCQLWVNVEQGQGMGTRYYINIYKTMHLLYFFSWMAWLGFLSAWNSTIITSGSIFYLVYLYPREKSFRDEVGIEPLPLSHDVIRLSTTTDRNPPGEFELI